MTNPFLKLNHSLISVNTLTTTLMNESAAVFLGEQTNTGELL